MKTFLCLLLFLTISNILAAELVCFSVEKLSGPDSSGEYTKYIRTDTVYDGDEVTVEDCISPLDKTVGNVLFEAVNNVHYTKQICLIGTRLGRSLGNCNDVIFVRKAYIK